MDNQQKQLDNYLIELFKLIEQTENVSRFTDLYLTTFNREPSTSVIENYKSRINSDRDDSIDDNDSYEDSYSYD
jgi:hypothetical protein